MPSGGLLAAHAETIKSAQIILASSSPRRVDILNNILGLGARVVPSKFPEDLEKSKFTPVEYVEVNARAKAQEVYKRLVATEGMPPSLVIGADTIVTRGGKILESPKAMQALGMGEAEALAKEMLASLSGGSHTICTGVALIYAPPAPGCDPHVESFVEKTEVQFCQLSQEIIDAYVSTGEPIDKAGAYAIQAMGGSFVVGISGCYHSAVGFPMHRFAAKLDCERLRQFVDVRWRWEEARDQRSK